MKRLFLILLCFLILFIAGCDPTTKLSSKESSLSSLSSLPSTTSSTSSLNLTKAEYVVQPSLDYGLYSPFNNGYAVVTKNEKFAFMDTSGKLLGNGFIYKNARSFTDSGLAAVEYEDGTYAFINKTGKKVLDEFDGKNFSDKNGIPNDFVNGLSVISVNNNSNWISAVINTQGNIVIPFDFTNKYTYSWFYNGISVRTAPGKPDALVDKTGKVLYISGEKEELSNGGSDGVLFYVKTSGSEPIIGLIDTSGKKLTSPLYYLNPQYTDFVNGLAFVQYVDSSKGNAFIDTKGNVKFTIPGITNAKVYDTVIVATCKDNLQYIYDRTGKKLCDKGFSRIVSFSNGVGCYYDNGKWGLIDNKGEIILQPVQSPTNGFTCSENLVIVMDNDKMGILKIKE